VSERTEERQEEKRQEEKRQEVEQLEFTERNENPGRDYFLRSIFRVSTYPPTFSR
jgi:hypothetical protein